MKSLKSLPSEATLRRLVFACVAAGLVVVIAVILAPPVADSIATLNLTSSELGELIDDAGVPSDLTPIDVADTTAAPVEPLSTSY